MEENRVKIPLVKGGIDMALPVPFDTKANKTMSMDEFDIHVTKCPKCGKVNWFPSAARFMVGGFVERYRCNEQKFGGKWCDATIDVTYEDADVVWVSPNGRWHITDPSQGEPQDEFYRRVVQASEDGDTYCTIQMYSDGSFRTDWDVPKYVLEAAKKILRAKAEASPKSRSPKSKERTTTKKTKRRRRHAKGQSIQKTPDG